MPTILRLAVLKENIRREIRNIPGDMIARAVANFNVRVANVIQQRGRSLD
jgi:hypothetical protein